MVPPKPQSKARLPDARFPVWSMSIKGFLLEHGATIRRRDQNVAIKAVERAHLWHFTGLGCGIIEAPQKANGHRQIFRARNILIFRERNI
ncbi:hypothetical protein [Bradyrhizobium sp. UFLA03-84]|uniref:hypothetical protein n=1 Tax=Bradyrhizobium sp. UFLA03-84 TaxID=418599 RepID=UPI001178A705|nr:hypothetical protein [Bradyrhizobium sp. UFLA03-84]